MIPKNPIGNKTKHQSTNLINWELGLNYPGLGLVETNV